VKRSDSNTKSILIVEDESSISDVCRRVLTKEGFTVDIAVNGKMAQDLLGKKIYELYLIDVRTPNMNGKELYEWLLKNFPQEINGVIFNTGDIKDDIGSFLETTGRPFLLKPFFPGDLITIVRETLLRTVR